MSLLTRIIGFALCFLGTFMIGWVQGIQSIVDITNRSISDIAPSIPNFPPVFQIFVQIQIQRNINPSIGSYWGFGVILAILGFILVARGDPKPKHELDMLPLEEEQVPEKKKSR